MMIPSAPIPSSILLITLFAALVNGALGYGFSSLTVPVALLYYTNRVLNPAMVLVEMAVNGYSLLINRKGLGQVWKRVLPIMLGLVPGIALGSYILFTVQPAWLRFFTYVVLMPLILLQAAGWRRPIRSERAIGGPFGVGVGLLYSLSTISGPPLAVLANNQGYTKLEFRAALALIRIVESVSTAIAYYFLGIYSRTSLGILSGIAPSVLIGMPIGAYVIQRMEAETFRRICMSFDAWIVGFGLSKVLIELRLAESPAAYGVLALVAAIDAWLLFNFFRARRVLGSGPNQL